MIVLLLGWWWVRILETISECGLCVHIACHPGFDLLLLFFQSLLTFLVVFVVDSEVSSNYRYRKWSKHQACQHYQYSESVSEPVSGIEVTISYCGHCNNSSPVSHFNWLEWKVWHVWIFWFAILWARAYDSFRILYFAIRFCFNFARK